MNKLIIDATEDSPSIEIDLSIGFFQFSGKSLPENSSEFFAPVEDIVKEYVKEPKPKTTINLKLEYLNSSSQKKFLGLISLFEGLPERGFEVDLNWIYSEDDEDMMDEGRDFSKMITLPMNITFDI